jgi:hypothetical protein
MSHAELIIIALPVAGLTIVVVMVILGIVIGK